MINHFITPPRKLLSKEPAGSSPLFHPQPVFFHPDWESHQGYILLPIRQNCWVRGAIGQSGQWRSAYFFQGGQFADFIKFIHLNTPENARVVLPPRDSGPSALSTTPLMQFFLAPRQVINCPDLA
jgi:hypothetical protein